MDERESRRKAKEQEQLSKGASDRYTQVRAAVHFLNVLTVWGEGYYRTSPSAVSTYWTVYI